MINFRLIIMCNAVCIVYMLLTYNRFLGSEFYGYIESKKYRIFPLLDIIFSLYVLGYISLFKSISDIYMRDIRNLNVFLGYYILQMSINFSFFLSFYELHMARLTAIINTFSLYAIMYFIYLWRTGIGISNIYLLLYSVTSYISSLLTSYIMRLKLHDDYRKKKYMYHDYNIIT